MTFSQIVSSIDYSTINSLLYNDDEKLIEPIPEKETIEYTDFLLLLSPAAICFQDKLEQKARQITKQHFGRTMQLYAPIYLANECDNECVYCGFNKSALIDRRKLSLVEIESECKTVKEKGFNSVLLLTGESESKAGVDYIINAVGVAVKYFKYVALEVFPTSTENYQKYLKAGVSGITIYQETYHSSTYTDMHLKGPKSDYNFRLDTPDRVFESGIRKVGIGALLGLFDFRYDAAVCALHASYLTKKYWRGETTVSFPRIRDHKGNLLKTKYKVEDKELRQIVIAYRLFLPWVGLVLSTRESSDIRDDFLDIGITQISAESKTNPGGYSNHGGSEQFSVADNRSLKEIVQVLKQKKYDPIFTDWSEVF